PSTQASRSRCRPDRERCAIRSVSLADRIEFRPARLKASADPGELCGLGLPPVLSDQMRRSAPTRRAARLREQPPFQSTIRGASLPACRTRAAELRRASRRLRPRHLQLAPPCAPAARRLHSSADRLRAPAYALEMALPAYPA